MDEARRVAGYLDDMVRRNSRCTRFLQRNALCAAGATQPQGFPFRNTWKPRYGSRDSGRCRNRVSTTRLPDVLDSLGIRVLIAQLRCRWWALLGSGPLALPPLTSCPPLISCSAGSAAARATSALGLLKWPSGVEPGGPFLCRGGAGEGGDGPSHGCGAGTLQPPSPACPWGRAIRRTCTRLSCARSSRRTSGRPTGPRRPPPKAMSYSPLTPARNDLRGDLGESTINKPKPYATHVAELAA